MSTRARPLMVQGTMSGAGKSFLVAGLLRVLADKGYKVAPFKAQNMALNSFVTKEGLEMGRAQVLQAQAARVEPVADMNPILLKPTTDTGSQVIVGGRPLATMGARDYFRLRHTLKPTIQESYDRLAATHDIILIEGAGSPVELNLRRDDICNMGMAKMVESPVLLVGDIDPGGIFAQLVGTMVLLEPDERQMVKALVVNKFRGDASLFAEGIEILEDRCGVLVAGVVPYVELHLEDEDSMAGRLKESGPAPAGQADVAVIRLPKVSNFTDFMALEADGALHVRYVRTASELGHPDLIVLPGTKSTTCDLAWLREVGLADAIQGAATQSIPILGICGGYQMLGRSIEDPEGLEGSPGTVEGLSLLPVRTLMRAHKKTRQTEGETLALDGPLSGLSHLRVRGYEIHQGETVRLGGAPFAHLEGREDGCCQGGVYGTYLHGLFDEPGVAASLASCLGYAEKANEGRGMAALRERELDRLAATVEESLDLELILKIMEEGL